MRQASKLYQQDPIIADTEMIEISSGLPEPHTAVMFLKWTGLLVGFVFPGLAGKTCAKPVANPMISGHSCGILLGEAFQPVCFELGICRASMETIAETPDLNTITDLSPRTSCM